MPYASQGLTELFGVKPEDVVDDASILGRVIHPDDRERIVATLDRSRETLTAWQCEYRVTVPGKAEKWIFAHAFPEQRARRLDALARLPDRRDRTETLRGAHPQARLFRRAHRPAQPQPDPRPAQGRAASQRPPRALGRAALPRPRPVQAAQRHQGTSRRRQAAPRSRRPALRHAQTGRRWSAATAATSS